MASSIVVALVEPAIAPSSSPLAPARSVTPSALPPLIATIVWLASK